MNIYDFDKTVYNGDSTVDFYKFCLKKYPKTRSSVIKTGWYFFMMMLRVYSKTQCKEKFYMSFLPRIPDMEKALEDFWAAHEKNMKKWYVDDKRRPDDIIISASPEFLLRPMCERLGVALLASRVDSATGAYTGRNCRGEEKVRRLREYMPEALEQMEQFYSDSIADTPLARLAQEAYMVKGDELLMWVVQ